MVSVERAKFHADVRAKRVARIAGKSLNPQFVVVLFGRHGEMIVGDHFLAAIPILHLDAQRVVGLVREIVNHVETEPVLFARLAEPLLVLARVAVKVQLARHATLNHRVAARVHVTVGAHCLTIGLKTGFDLQHHVFQIALAIVVVAVLESMCVCEVNRSIYKDEF